MTRNYHFLRFCPWCGSRTSLRHDDYRHQRDTGKQRGVEWICDLCGFGFVIGPSKRVSAADLLFAEHRKLRVGKFHEGVREDVRQVFECANPLTGVKS